MSSPRADSWANQTEPLSNSALCCAFHESEQLSPSHSLPLPQTQAMKAAIQTQGSEALLHTLFWGSVMICKHNHSMAGAVLVYRMPCLLLDTLHPLARVPLLVQHDESGKSVPVWLSAAYHSQREQTAMCTLVAHDSIRSFRQPKSKLYLQFFFVLGVRNATHTTRFT